jgi:hypothetical protein
MTKQSRYNESEIVDVTGFVIHRPASGLSILFNVENNSDGAVFLPLSQIEIHNSGNITDASVTVMMPEWLARDKGLI